MPKYPGWGFPLRQQYDWREGTYPTILDDGEPESHMIQVREVAMMYIMEKFTDRDDWHKMIFDQEHMRQWREEMLAIPDNVFKHIVYTGNEDDLVDNEPVMSSDDWREPWYIKFTHIVTDAVLHSVCSHSGETC